MDDGREVSAVSVQRRSYDDVPALAVEWDFAVRGGSFGEHEADLFVAACAEAVGTRTPLVTVLRSGGTRLQEGMRALVGIPRASLALADVRAAGVPHLCVTASPTTGGVWVAIGSQADLRVGVRGATVGFSGPRVIEAMTGTALAADANTAESALAAGLLDDVVDAADVDAWVARALHVLTHAPAPVSTPVDRVQGPARRGWQQVRHSREVERPCGRDIIRAVLDQRVQLRGADASVEASIGLLRGRPAAMVAVAGRRAARVTPAGYRLLERAALLCAHLSMPLVTLVDTAGADPLPDSEQGGVAAAIASSLNAVLRCSAPTVAVVHGEGGSGGALAAAVCDLVAVTPHGWFAALAPEGAAAALRRAPEEAADLMRVSPAELVEDGFADAVAPADPSALGDWLAAALGRFAETDPHARVQRRERRWRAPLRPDGSDALP